MPIQTIEKKLSIPELAYEILYCFDGKGKNHILCLPFAFHLISLRLSERRSVDCYDEEEIKKAIKYLARHGRVETKPRITRNLGQSTKKSSGVVLVTKL